MRSLARLATASATRRLSTSSSAFAEAASGLGASAADAGAASRAAFQEKLRPFLSSTSAPPSFPTDFMKPKPVAEAGAGVPDKLTLNFFLPHEQPKKGAAVRHFFFSRLGRGGGGARASCHRLPLLLSEVEPPSEREGVGRGRRHPQAASGPLRAARHAPPRHSQPSNSLEHGGGGGGGGWGAAPVTPLCPPPNARGCNRAICLTTEPSSSVRRDGDG